VPASVQVFSGQRIENSGVQRASDFVNLTPGVTIVDAAEVGDTQVNIRGINGARDAENSFALIIDGILMTNPASLNREYTNLQQIEILNRNAAAGAIIITTEKPGEETSGAITVSGAEDSTYYLAGNVGGQVSDGVYWSLSGDYRETDGYYDNVIDRLGSLTFAEPGGATVDNFENWNIQGRLIFEPSDATTVDAKLRYGEVDGASITFNGAFALPEFVGVTGFTEWYRDVNDHPFYFQNNIDSSNDQEALELSVKVDHQMDWGTFTGRTRPIHLAYCLPRSFTVICPYSRQAFTVRTCLPLAMAPSTRRGTRKTCPSSYVLPPTTINACVGRQVSIT
jgi:iron complex outermembrane receptor protein